jgi:hypothetical protein
MTTETRDPARVPTGHGWALREPTRAHGTRARQRPRRTRPVALRSPWDRAVDDFGAAWDLSRTERVILALTLRTPTRHLDMLVRELLAEAGGLAVETARPEEAAWCYAVCERMTSDLGDLPPWDELAMERRLLEALVPPAVRGTGPQPLVWWCVRLVPASRDEAPDGARRRLTTSALYLAVVAVRALTAGDRARAGVLAALGAIVARRTRETGAAG